MLEKTYTKLQAALGKLFGSSSEKISPDQLALELGVDSVALGMPEAETEEVIVPRREHKYKPLNERIPEDLPVEEIILEPAAVLADPEAFKRIGEEAPEELDVVPTKFFKRRTDRSLPPVIAPHPNGLSTTPTPPLGCS
ncbi:MAG: transposase [Pontiella sp.]